MWMWTESQSVLHNEHSLCVTCQTGSFVYEDLTWLTTFNQMDNPNRHKRDDADRVRSGSKVISNTHTQEEDVEVRFYLLKISSGVSLMTYSLKIITVLNPAKGLQMWKVTKYISKYLYCMSYFLLYLSTFHRGILYFLMPLYLG